MRYNRRALIALLFVASNVGLDTGLAQTPAPVFPTRAATDSDLFILSNSCGGSGTLRLARTINQTATVIPVVTAAGCTAPMLIKIENEIVAIASISGSGLNVATSGRGFGGTTAAGHAIGMTATTGFLPPSWNQARAEIEAIETYVLGLGAGNVQGPLSSTAGHIPQFSDASGRVLADGLCVATTLGNPGVNTCVPSEAAVRLAISNAGGGTVSSVGIAVPNWLTAGGGPITSIGTITIAAAAGQPGNQVLATPSGTSGALTPRALVGADIPVISLTTNGPGGIGGVLAGGNGGTNSAFVQFLGPGVLHNFTLPNADAAILTTAALVSGLQGGTGNGFFQVAGPAGTLKNFTFPNANATVITNIDVGTVTNTMLGGAITTAKLAAISGNGGTVVTSIGSPADGCAAWAGGNMGTTGLPCGAGGTPAAPVNSVQYNNSGALAGLSNVATTRRYLTQAGDGGNAFAPQFNGIALDASFPTVTVPFGGLGVTTLLAKGVVLGNGTNPVTVADAGSTTGLCLVTNGASAPSFQQCPSVSAGGGGGNSANFTTATSVTVPGLGTQNVTLACFNTQNQAIQPDAWSISGAAPNNVTASFSVTASGRCVITGMGKYVTSLQSGTTWSITGATHGFATAGIAVAFYDNATPRHRIEPDSVAVDPSTFNVTANFAIAQSGYAVIE